MINFLFALLLLPALYPDGYPLGRWRRAVPVVAGAWGVLIAVFMLTERPLTNRFLEVFNPPSNPTGILPVPEDVINTAWLLLMVASVVVGIGSVITRWRTADTELRQRLKWALYAFGLFGFAQALVLLDTILFEVAGVYLGSTRPLDALAAGSALVLVIALGFGVLRYRLYDVDLVINRTVVYGIMTALVAAAYVAVVVGVGALVPTGGNLGLSLLAAAIVAVAFNPVRNRVQRAVNRVMFGRRDDPYTVLSELGRLLAQSGEPDATLDSLVQTVAEALKLHGVAFELEQDGTWETRALAGHLGDNVETIKLRHQGELVGRLVVAPRSAHEGLHADDRRLLEDVAHQAAGLAHTMRLTQALQRSREQLVLAREEERRRLRRDLHDGLGPSLASQTFRLDAVLALLADNRPDVAQLVTSLKRQNQELVADIRRLVYELRPPALDELGLVGALAAHGGQLDRSNDLRVEVTTDPDPLGDLPAAVEVAAYRIAREAVTNVARHAAATTCRISLELTDSALLIRVVDDGVGVRAVTEPGVGMTSMRERAEELGGSLRVSRLDGAGTEVFATLPMATLPGRAAVESATGSEPAPPNRPVPSAVEVPHG